METSLWRYCLRCTIARFICSLAFQGLDLVCQYFEKTCGESVPAESHHVSRLRGVDREVEGRL
jgi:hypothetical protein